MDIRDLIPKDKGDVETALKLTGHSYSELKPIIPELLQWLQDMNWPVSRPVAEYLETITEEISDEILKILRGDDGVWKYWIIIVFGCITQNPEVLKEIQRIANNPTNDDKDCEVDEIATECLNERRNKE